jgi:hypothetical protein
MKRKFLVRISRVYNLFIRKKVLGANGPSDLKEFNENIVRNLAEGIIDAVFGESGGS